LAVAPRLAEEAVNQVSATIAFGPGAEAGVYRGSLLGFGVESGLAVRGHGGGAQGTAAN